MARNKTGLKNRAGKKRPSLEDSRPAKRHAPSQPASPGQVDRSPSPSSSGLARTNGPSTPTNQTGGAGENDSPPRSDRSSSSPNDESSDEESDIFVDASQRHEADHQAVDDVLPDPGGFLLEVRGMKKEELYAFVYKDDDETARYARKVAIVQHLGLIPCPGDAHHSADDSEVDTFPLSETYQWHPPARGRPVQSLAEKSSLVGLRRARMTKTVSPDPGLIGKNPAELLPSASLASAFSGSTLYTDKGYRIDPVYRDAEYGREASAPTFSVGNALPYYRRLDEVKQSVWLSLFPQRKPMSRAAIHTRFRLSFEGEKGRTTAEAPLYQVPHIYFGAVKNTPLYVFFPRLWGQWGPAQRQRGGWMIPDTVYRRWYEEVLLPGVKSIMGAVVPHLSTDFDTAKAAAVGLATDWKATDWKGDPVYGGLPIGSDDLARFWQAMQEQLAGTGAEWLSRHFGEAFLLEDTGHGEPLKTKHGLLNTCLDEFRVGKDLRTTGPDDFVPGALQFLDIAAEFKAKPVDYNTAAMTVFGRDCCQENTLQFLFGTRDTDVANTLGTCYDEDVPEPEPAPAAEARPVAGNRKKYGAGMPRDATVPGQWFNTDVGIGIDEVSDVSECIKDPMFRYCDVETYPAFQLDAFCSVTCTPRPRSAAYTAGIRHYHAYPSIAEAFACRGERPFQLPGLCQLVHAGPFWDMLAKQKTIATQYSKLWDRYNSDLFEAKRALTGMERRSYGFRIELRVTPGFADRLQEAEAEFFAAVSRANEQEPATRGFPLLSASDLSNRVGEIFDFASARNQELAANVVPDHGGVTVLPSTTTASFLYGNVNKHVTLLDSILLAQRALRGKATRATPRGVATLFRLVLLSLSHFVNPTSYYRRRLLDDPIASSSSSQPKWSGIGLWSSRSRRGFAFWPEDLVDWERFAVADGYLALIQPQTNLLVPPRATLSNIVLGDSMFDELVKIYAMPQLQKAEFAVMEEILVCFLLREYRSAMIGKLFPRIEISQEALLLRNDSFHFTVQSFAKLSANHSGRGVNVVTGNRGTLKTAVEYFDWMWTNENLEGTASRSRSFIKGFDFRKHYETVQQVNGDERLALANHDRFKRLLMHRFFQQHSAVPYPESNGTPISTNKQHERQLWAWTYACRTQDPPPVDHQPFREIVIQADKDARSSSEPYLRPRGIIMVQTLEDVGTILFGVRQQTDR